MAPAPTSGSNAFRELRVARPGEPTSKPSPAAARLSRSEEATATTAPARTADQEIAGSGRAATATGWAMPTLKSVMTASGLEVVAAHGEEQDDRQGHADHEEQDGAHGWVSSIDFAPVRRLKRGGSLTVKRPWFRLVPPNDDNLPLSP